MSEDEPSMTQNVSEDAGDESSGGEASPQEASPPIPVVQAPEPSAESKLERMESEVGPAPRTPAGYVGLGRWQQFVIVFVGVLLGAAAFMGSWSLARRSADRLGIEKSDGALISSMSGACEQEGSTKAKCITDPNARVALQFRALETYAHLKAISNQQSVGVLAIGAGMALISVGFSLFLIGAEGAFKLRASSPGRSNDNVMLYGTAPGLLAFALATVIIGIGATRRHDLSFTADLPPPAEPGSTPDDSNVRVRLLCQEFDANPSGFSPESQELLDAACDNRNPNGAMQPPSVDSGGDPGSCDDEMRADMEANPQDYSPSERDRCLGVTPKTDPQ